MFPFDCVSLHVSLNSMQLHGHITHDHRTAQPRRMQAHLFNKRTSDICPRSLPLTLYKQTIIRIPFDDKEGKAMGKKMFSPLQRRLPEKCHFEDLYCTPFQCFLEICWLSTDLAIGRFLKSILSSLPPPPCVCVCLSAVCRLIWVYSCV